MKTIEYKQKMSIRKKGTISKTKRKIIYKDKVYYGWSEFTKLTGISRYSFNKFLQMS